MPSIHDVKQWVPIIQKMIRAKNWGIVAADFNGKILSVFGTLKPFQIGDTIRHDSPMYRAIERRNTEEFIIPEDVYGKPLQAFVMPLDDGIVGILVDTSIQHTLKSSMESVYGVVEHVGSSVGELGKMSQRMRNNFNEMADEIVQMNESFTSIMEMNKLISYVADQTHLLSLNAAIESARLGDEGRAFGVVAQEMRKLANQTNDSAGQILQRIKHIQNEMEKIKHKIEESTAASAQHETAVQEIAASMEQMASSVDHINQFARENL
ncbi:methyl-accepting chemotaxis protein (MCP) signaling protein [Aneurinibacillus soli]|uniref:Putative sensory transducer protein YfmS n=1 Tax=Aneurinibacillus soli TaxID=1500254 RepID=A0A0U5B6Z2_9BACL|nr:methyl-accepting chemotaxis protein [Aneurinibacillus soli]PYE63653.1 methyl-accepting chemotaxis protein (MCP) signaling protein [Aneurinibacillus soli]BAU27414.1 putative sensory transducer protein YfmS [Aneurinibacillus soli]